MVCTTCNKEFSHDRDGFAICPHCGTVNVANNGMAPTFVTSTFVPDTPKPPKRTLRLPHPKLIVAGVATGIVLIGLVGAGGYAFAQNKKALQYLHSASQASSKGDYSAAASNLEKGAKLHVFGATKKKLSDAKNKNQAWLGDAAKVKQASDLVAAGKFEDAKNILAQIGKDYPDYKDITALYKNIDDKLAANAKKVADDAAAAAAAAKSTAKKPVAKTVPATTANTAGKRFTSTAAVGDLKAATNLTQATAALQKFLSQYNASAWISGFTTDYDFNYWSKMDYLGEGDLAQLKDYGAVFIDEWAKYPTDWVANGKLQHVAFVKHLYVIGTYRAATPNPSDSTMYYDVAYGSGDYAREVVHHEFDHFITQKYFNTSFPTDPAYTAYNAPGFTYGNGGASCYQPNNTCLTGEHPIPGFVNGYAASSIAEDQAELYAYLMTSTYNHQLKEWIKTDANLAGKVNVYKQFIASHSPEMSGSYFDDINP
jgi:HEPN domain-containing protein